MYLYDRSMVATTNLKYNNSTLNYYVIMTVQNLKIFKTENFQFFRIPEARSAELKQITTA